LTQFRLWPAILDAGLYGGFSDLWANRKSLLLSSCPSRDGGFRAYLSDHVRRSSIGTAAGRIDAMTSTPTKRVAIYARVSTVGKGQDVGMQLDELRQVVGQRGWQVAGEYIDDGVSGTKDSRPALDRMMTDVRRGRVDVVLVWRFDRFARSTSHLLTALDEFRRRGVDFISLREQVDTSTAMGRAVFTIVAAIAELEREIIVERVRAGVARAQARGKHCGRPRRELDLRAARLLLAQGIGIRQVAAMLGLPRTSLTRQLREAGVGIGDNAIDGGPEVPDEKTV
jgi:DNA invertase Pin-like site-specific DNA recombinase